MKQYSEFPLTFLQIFLWIALASTIIMALTIVFFILTVALDLQLEFLNNIKMSFGSEETTVRELKSKGMVNFVLFSAAALYYLYIFSQLIRTGISALNKVDFQSPFSSDTAAKISRMGNLALQLGILNLFINAIIGLVFYGEFRLNIDFANFNFFVIAAILYLVGNIFKRGREMQDENELTI